MESLIFGMRLWQRKRIQEWSICWLGSLWGDIGLTPCRKIHCKKWYLKGDLIFEWSPRMRCLCEILVWRRLVDPAKSWSSFCCWQICYQASVYWNWKMESHHFHCGLWTKGGIAHVYTWLRELICLDLATERKKGKVTFTTIYFEEGLQCKYLNFWSSTAVQSGWGIPIIYTSVFHVQQGAKGALLWSLD